jgi:Transketolase, thiamine diphosphate binding domain
MRGSTDPDTLETGEWIDSLRAVLHYRGPDRAAVLIEQLTDEAQRAVAIYQARFLKYLHGRGIADTAGRKVWAFMGDGEMDEPESLGAVSLAGRERLDNLIYVINCNLRAARFGVSPMTACSRAAPSPIKSPTTTVPVAMPMRTCNSAPKSVWRLATAATSASPARVACSASSSCAWG